MFFNTTVSPIKLTRLIAISAGVFVLFVGFISMIGWLTHTQVLIQLGAPSNVIQFNTSLCLFVLGLALLSIFVEKKLWFSKALGLFVFIISILSIIEYIYNISLVSQFFFKNILLENQPDFPGRPPLITVMGMLLGGLAFILYSRNPLSILRSLLFNCLGFCILGIGLFGLLSLFAPIEASFGFINSNEISLQTAISFIILGLGIIAASFNTSFISSLPILDSLAYIVIFFGILLTILLCSGLNNYQQKAVRRVTLHVSTAIQNLIENKLNQYEKDTRRLFLNLAKNDFKFDEREKAENLNYLTDYEEDKVIGWINDQLKVTYLVSLQNFKNLIGTSLFLRDEANRVFFPKLKQKPSTMILNFDSPFEDNVFVILFPLFEKGVFKGGLFNLLDSQKLLEGSIPSVITDQFIFSIWNEKEKEMLYGESNFTPYVETTLLKGKDELVLKVAPRKKTYSLLIDNSLIALIFFIGIFNTLVLAAFVHYWKSNYFRLREIKQIKNNLNLALSSAHLGTWTWDAFTNQTSWDAYTSRMLGLAPANFKGNLEDLIHNLHPNDQSTEKNKIIEASAQQTTYQSEVKVYWPDHTIHHLFFIGRLNKEDINEPRKMYGICWDITAIRESHNLLETEFAITNVLKQADSLESASPHILELLCTKLDWDIGAFWVISEHHVNKLECLSIWHSSSSSYPHFTNSSRQLYLPKGMGFPGNIWAENRPLWIDNLTADLPQPHASEAIIDGLRGVFGFPILDERGTIGIIELYRTQPILESMKADLLNFSSSISHSIAQFYWRSKDDKMRNEMAAIVEFSRDAIYSRDLQGKIINWNQGAIDLLGYSVEEVLGKTDEILIPPDRKNEFNWLLAEVRSGKVIKSFETQRINKDGQYIWVQMTSSPIRDKTGKVTKISIIAQNIDLVKKIEETLRENEEKLKAFVETTNEWIWALDLQRKITYSNPTIESLLGYALDQIMSIDIALLIHEEDRDTFIQSFNDAVKRKRGWLSQTLRWHHKNGSYIWMEGNSEIIDGPNNSIIGFRGASRDVSEGKKLEKLKDEFLSMVNHELRTPLTSIQGALALIIGRFSSELSPKIHQLFSIALNNSERLIRIINDILDIQKMEAGKLSLKLELLNLYSVIQESLKDIQPFANKFDVSVVTENISENIVLNTDSNRLIQVMNNLLSNAIKFSPPKSQVSISAQIQDQNVKISIKDHGEGIPENIQPLIFQKFVQADSSISKKIAGTGLGLVITKNLIEQLGGKIYFESTPKVGTTFYFELPLEN